MATLPVSFVSHFIPVPVPVSIFFSCRPTLSQSPVSSNLFTSLSMATKSRAILSTLLRTTLNPHCRHLSSATSAATAPLFTEFYGVSKEYDEYRRSLYGQITHKALLVDAVGTLVVPSQPMAQVYREIGEKYGVEYSEEEILRRYRWAYEQPWGGSRLRYVDDGKPFWKFIVRSSTGCSDPKYFEELYDYYATEKAWRICDPDAEEVFKALRESGVKLAIVSNFDTRLRPVLRALNCDHWFDALAVSAEVAAEKPNPIIFLKAFELLGVKPEDAVHVGDDRRNDIWGARDAGCDAWLWGSEVHSFKEVAQRIGVRV